MLSLGLVSPELIFFNLFLFQPVSTCFNLAWQA